MRRFIVMVLIALLIFSLSPILSIPIYFAIPLAFIILMLNFYYPYVTTLLLSRNTKRIEQFLIKQKKEPLYQLYYGLGIDDHDEIEESLGRLIAKDKNGKRRALFQVIASLHKDDDDTAEAYLESVAPTAYKQYYELMIELKRNNLDEVEGKVESLEKNWMKTIIKAELARKRGNQEEAEELEEKALNQVRGLQYYLLIKHYEREEKARGNNTHPSSPA